jgi:hypothetical protein
LRPPASDVGGALPVAVVGVLVGAAVAVAVLLAVVVKGPRSPSSPSQAAPGSLSEAAQQLARKVVPWIVRQFGEERDAPDGH